MKYVFLVLLAITLTIHLYHCWKDDEKKAKYTKPLLLPLILGYYLCATASPTIEIILALIFSFLGDVFLISKDDRLFFVGGSCFTTTHCLYIGTYVDNIDFSKVIWFIVIPIALIYYAVSVSDMLFIRKHLPKILFGPMLLYLVCNSTMNGFAIMQIMTYKNLASILIYIGAILFITSDCCLYILRFHKNKELIPKKHFTIMATYVPAQFLITTGLIMLGR